MWALLYDEQLEYPCLGESEGVVADRYHIR